MAGHWCFEEWTDHCYIFMEHWDGKYLNLDLKLAQGMIGNSFIEKSNNSTFLTFWAGISINKAMHIINGNLKSSIKISYINCDRGFTSKGKIEEIKNHMVNNLSLIHISEPTRPY